MSPRRDPDIAAWLRAEARDPTTPPARLRDLAEDPEHATRRLLEALAANPSTPPATLATLIEDTPAAFCRNPVAPLLALEDPGFPDTISPAGVGLLLRSPRAPGTLVALVAQWEARPRDPDSAYRPELAQAARMHRSLAGDLAPEDWAQQVREYWEGYARQRNREEDTHALLELVELDCLPRDFAPAAERRDPPLPQLPDDFRYRFNTPEMRKELTVDDDAAVRRQARRQRGLPEGTRDWSRASVLRRALCRQVKRMREEPEHLHCDHRPMEMLTRFLALQQAPEPVRRPFWRAFARSPVWQDRLAAAVSIGPRPNGQPARPRHRVLLGLLAEDGNRLVSAAARGRLRGETFSW